MDNFYVGSKTHPCFPYELQNGQVRYCIYQEEPAEYNMVGIVLFVSKKLIINPEEPNKVIIAFGGGDDSMSYKGEVGDYYKYEEVLDVTHNADVDVYLNRVAGGPYYTFYFGNVVS